MEENIIENSIVVSDSNSIFNYTDIQTTNILLSIMVILHISIFIYIFLKQCFDFKS